MDDDEAFAEAVRSTLDRRVRASRSLADGLVVQDVTLSGQEVLVLFTEANDTAYQYEFAWPAAAPDDSPAGFWTPEEWADVGLANLEEELDGVGGLRRRSRRGKVRI